MLVFQNRLKTIELNQQGVSKKQQDHSEQHGDCHKADINAGNKPKNEIIPLFLDFMNGIQTRHHGQDAFGRGPQQCQDCERHVCGCQSSVQ